MTDNETNDDGGDDPIGPNGDQRPAPSPLRFNLLMLICVQAAFAIAIALLVAIGATEIRFLTYFVIPFAVGCVITFVMVSASTGIAKKMSRKTGRTFIAASVLIYMAIRLVVALCGWGLNR